MKPTIPDVIDRFAAYKRSNPSWGSLHIVLDDQNVSNDCVDYCAELAGDQCDSEGVVLADILSKMSKTQRLKLSRIL